MLKKLSFLLLILLVLSMPVKAVRNDSFFLENNMGLDFMNGHYKIEVIEIGKPGDMPFVKLNLITGGMEKQCYLRENEKPSIDTEPFNKINLNSSFITLTVAKVTVEFPDTWPAPVKYTIERPVVAEKVPNVVLTKSVDRTIINKGDIVEFKIVLENTGNGTAYNLSLDENLPSGFTKAQGSKFPPTIQEELKAGEHLELLFALKAVEPGSYNIEPTIVKYGANSARSDPLSLTVLDEKKEKSNLSTVITLDKNSIFTGESVKM